MKEMQLFEVGFKKGYVGLGYWAKFYVAARDDLDARSMARRWIERDYQNLDDKGFEEDEIDEMMEELESLQVARIHHINQVVIA